MGSESYALMVLIFVLGAVVGAVIMFFVAQKNPKWIQDIYEKQKGVTSDVRQELDAAKQKIADLELDKKIEAKFKELTGK